MVISALRSAITHKSIQYNNIHNNLLVIDDHIFIKDEYLITYDMTQDDELNMLLYSNHVR